jgi:hypothetical protein
MSIKCLQLVPGSWGRCILWMHQQPINDHSYTSISIYGQLQAANHVHASGLPVFPTALQLADENGWRDNPAGCPAVNHNFKRHSLKCKYMYISLRTCFVRCNYPQCVGYHWYLIAMGHINWCLIKLYMYIQIRSRTTACVTSLWSFSPYNIYSKPGIFQGIAGFVNYS